jgi:hypothetical protein
MNQDADVHVVYRLAKNQAIEQAARRATEKSCSRCPNPVRYSVAVLLSTLGAQPRLQKCSRAVLLCTACLQSAARSSGASPIPDLYERLSAVYTAIAGQFSSPTEVNSASSAVAEVNL